MIKWTQTLVEPTQSIRETIEIIDCSSAQIALVVNEDRILLGTVTDGDIRRAIIKGVSLDEPVSEIMFSTPTVAIDDCSQESILSLMNRKGLRQIPIVDKCGRLQGLKLKDEFFTPKTRENTVVIMAGGLGSRLGSLTKDRPKPLLTVGDKPLLETILTTFVINGFNKFYFAVNHLSYQIKDYFQDGQKWNVEIRYLEESKKLGTAGALSLLPDKPRAPLIVMNGDILTKVDFQKLLDFHIQNGPVGTMCVREYNFQIPYGVVKTDSTRIISIDEKPCFRYFVNAGIYVLEPHILETIPKDQHFDMTALFENLLIKGEKTIVFPIREYWIDIGRTEDFYRAEAEFQQFFTSEK